MSSLAADLRFALRLFWKRPGFTLLIVLVLGLGIGANVAIFGLVQQVLLRPLPFAEPDRLVRVSGTNRNGTGPLSYPDFLDIRQRNRVFSDVALIDEGDPILTSGDEPQRIKGMRVSPAYLSVLGIEPALGRFFAPEEEEFGQHRVAVLSHDLWRERFAGDPGIVGREILLWGEYKYVVTGILPAGFEDAEVHYATRPQIWRPLAVHPERHYRDGRSYDGVIARLRPGITLQQARSDLDRIAGELLEEYPEDNFDQGFIVRPLHEATVGEVRPALLALSVAVALVLLIACSNVANMLLARTAGRRRELAVRTSLGASHGQLVRQLFAESLLLATAAGVVGLFLAVWSAEVLILAAASHLPRLTTFPIDFGLFAFTALIALATALASGLAAALPSVRGDLQPGLRSDASGLVGGRRRLQSVLAIAEVGLALTLLIGVGLLTRSLWQLLDVDPGFEPSGALVASTTMDSEKVPELLQRVRSLPGVEQAGVTSMLPLTDNYSCDGFLIDARPTPPGQEDCAEFRVVSDGYFEAMGIPLVRGRLFTAQDLKDAAPVALIDEAMAARFWPGEDPIGQRLTKTGGTRISREIVGVVGSVRHFGLDRERQPEYFVPQAQYEYQINPALVVRSNLPPASLGPTLRSKIRRLDAVTTLEIATLAESVRRSVAEPRFRVQLIGLFGLLAAVLAAVGVYGVMAFSVHQRTRELGVRTALGADRGALLRRVLGDGLRLTLPGIAWGLLGGALLSRLLAGLLFQVSALDVWTYGAMAAFVALVGLLACYVPALRASRVDPIIALRHE